MPHDYIDSIGRHSVQIRRLKCTTTYFSVPFYLPFSSVQILHTFLLCICHLHLCTNAEFFCTTNKAFIVRLYQNFPRYEKSRLVQKRVASIQRGPGTDPVGHRSSHKLYTGAIFRGGCKLLVILYCLNIYLIFIAMDIKVCVHNEHCAIILCLFHHVPL